VKIKGKDEFLRQLQALPDAMRAEITKALETSAEETTDLMKRFAPVKTGALRASIGWNFGAPKEGSRMSSAARSAKGEADLAAVMYAGDEVAFYARFIEFGTAPHTNAGKFAGSHNPGLPPRPFFYPGYRLGKKRAKSRLSRAIRNGAKKAFSK
jgi:HK97 gp10 family phage protein